MATAQPRLKSEDVIINAPMSFAGAAQRAWRLGESFGKVRLVWVIPLLMLWWVLVLAWYVLLTGLVFVALPYRLLRRGARKRKAEALRHREMLSAIEAKQESPKAPTATAQ